MTAEINVIDRTNLHTSIGMIGGVGSLDLGEIGDTIALLATEENNPKIRFISPERLRRHPSAALLYIPALINRTKSGTTAALMTYTGGERPIPVVMDLSHVLAMLSYVYRVKEGDSRLTSEEIAVDGSALISLGVVFERLRPFAKGYAGYLLYAIWLAYPILQRFYRSMFGYVMYLDSATIADFTTYTNILAAGLSSLRDADPFDSAPASIVRDWLCAGLLLSIVSANPETEDLGDLLPGFIRKDIDYAAIRQPSKIELVINSALNMQVDIPVRPQVRKLMQHLVNNGSLQKLPVLYLSLNEESEKQAWQAFETSYVKTAKKNRGVQFYAYISATKDKTLNVNVIQNLL
jgi:hypothetical protein